MKPKISIVVNTYNEEKNIRGCLECVKWADEIIIVDMYSNDRTVEIAQEYTDRILMHENVGYCEPARQFGIDHTSNEWVFIVDADEHVPLKLRQRIVGLMEENTWDVIIIPRRNYFFGHPWEGTGHGPLQDMLPRVFRKTIVNWPAAVHQLPKIPPAARVFRLSDASCALEHFAWVGVSQYLSRLIFYASVEARDTVDGGRRISVIGLMNLVLRDFLWRWLWKRGYKDGLNGLAICIVIVSYQAMIALFQNVMMRYGVEDPDTGVRNDYENILSRLIKEYDADKQVQSIEHKDAAT